AKHLSAKDLAHVGIFATLQVLHECCSWQLSRCEDRVASASNTFFVLGHKAAPEVVAEGNPLECIHSWRAVRSGSPDICIAFLRREVHAEGFDECELFPLLDVTS